MLKIPPVTKVDSTKVVEDQNMKALYQKLTEQNSFPNIITLDVFREFEPLFRKENDLSQEDVKKLTEKYNKLVNFYKETQIIVSQTDPTVILTLPSIFTPIRSLTPTKENSSLVATNAAMANHNVPKYSSDAFANMFNALRKEQSNNTAVVESYKERYVACIQNFYATYKGLKQDFKKPEEENNSSDNQTEWE